MFANAEPQDALPVPHCNIVDQPHPESHREIVDHLQPHPESHREIVDHHPPSQIQIQIV
ncbi:hypothetical protein PGTUg99_018355 [Puccinia graminis f. sp. tritici]|uniref:Uncharacterized protein n=1 Tax=Puccinia graminis f. sp. tritici TaxID=56615 RepID=A0A5B0RLG1_PUCGR|nr:hypothetical protein PGTUg99_018355 [Puccinia graminis f. sp. tritici]